MVSHLFVEAYWRGTAPEQLSLVLLQDLVCHSLCRLGMMLVMSPIVLCCSAPGFRYQNSLSIPPISIHPVKANCAFALSWHIPIWKFNLSELKASAL